MSNDATIDPVEDESAEEPTVVESESLGSNLVSDQELMIILKRLASWRRNDQNWANERIQSLDLKALLNFWERSYPYELRRGRIKKWSLVALAVCGLIQDLVSSNPTLIFIALAVLLLMRRRGNRFSNAGIIALARFDELGAIGTLVATLGTKDAKMITAVTPALMRLLPRLTAMDANLITPPQRRLLRKYMERDVPGSYIMSAQATKDAALRVAILKALEQVGDSSFEPAVAAWANGNRAGFDPRVRSAAKECLGFLKQRHERSKVEKELLRGSGVDSVATDSLVRPVTHAESECADELLRMPTDDDG